MAREDGINVVLQVGDGTTVEGFTTLGGQISTTLSRAKAAVDTSDKGSADARSVDGKRSATVTCTGNAVWPATADLDRLEAIYNATGITINCRLIREASGTYYEGAFNITQFDIQGDDGSATQYSLTLVNTDGLTKTTV